MSQPLTGKTILVTGGSLGIGRAVVQSLAEAGAQVIVASRTESDLKKTVEELKTATKREHHYQILDVSNADAVKNCADWVQKKFGSIDGVVNCAGIYGPIGPIHEINPSEFKAAIEINFLGTFYVCHYFVPLLKAKKGKIINYSGGGAATPFPNFSAYATSKIAIVRLTENLSEELKPLGIDVNCIAPGFVITRLHDQTLKAGDKAGTAFLEGTKKQIQGGGVPPEKAAKLTVFLMSDASAGINGRFISAPWDPWETPEFQAKLKSEKNLATLRRIDQKTFTEIAK